VAVAAKDCGFAALRKKGLPTRPNTNSIRLIDGRPAAGADGRYGFRRADAIPKTPETALPMMQVDLSLAP
jgi:hypothetical protein